MAEQKNNHQDIAMDPIIANAPQHQFARKAYFWQHVNILRNQTGLPIHVAYRHYNARELEAEYKRLSKRQTQQTIARQATQALQKRQIKKVAKQATQAARTRTVRIERKEEENKVQNFFMNPIANREIEITRLPMREVVPYIALAPGFNLILSAGDNYWTVNNGNINRIIDDLKAEVMEIQEGNGSDAEIVNIINNPNIRTKFIWRATGRRRPNGGYFKYYHKLDKIDLSRYGIYRNEEETNKYELNCLEIALINAGIEKDKFDKLKTLIKTRYIPQKDLKIVAQQLKIYIAVCKLDSHNNTTYYGNKQHQKVHIGLIDEHYFLIEKTSYTSYSIVNYFDVCDKENFNRIYRKDGNKYKRADRFINSYEIIKILQDNKQTHLEEITMSNCGVFSQYSNRVFDYTILPEIDNKELKYCRPKNLRKPKIFIDQEATDEYKKIKKMLPCDFDYNDDEAETDNNIYHPYEVLYFDTEATIDEECHKPYMICSETRNGEKKYFNGPNCILKWLQSLNKNYLCIAHNLRYDFQFIVKYLSQADNMIKTGNKIKSISGKFYNINTNKSILLQFKDSYGLISMPLKKFGKCFNLDVKKEIMPYEAYNKDTVNKKYIEIDYAAKFVYEEKADFIRNINDWELQNGKYFNHIDYAYKYCEMDVSVLKKGYETFRGWMQEVCNLDIDNAVSIPQVANTYGLNQNVFQGCYKISGVPRDFIQKCVVGGRCMTRRNEKFKITHDVDDFDGVSLYPSAMHRMEGFLMGKPKVITEEIKDKIMNQLFSTEEITIEEKIDTEVKILNKLFSYKSNYKTNARAPKAYMIASRTRATGLDLSRMLPSYSKEEFDDMVNYTKKPLTIASYIKGMKEEDVKDWKKYINSIKAPDGYFIEIEVLDIKKNRDFPLLSRKNDEGIRMFSNDIRGSRIFVDKTSLEDLIKFQEIEFRIIRGYYYNEGRNTTIKTFIKGLFDERLKKKKEKNPIQEVYKLIMNAFYGKLIMKPIEYNYSFIYGKDTFEKHLQYRFNSISQYTKITNGLFFVKEARSILDHYRMPHCGTEVLSASKRIMNEVMCLAEDMNIEIYYQDTDSMHIDARLDSDGMSGVEKLSNAYRVVYGRELVGKHLGQFHSDFDYESEKMPLSVESIYLGKKSYCDRIKVIRNGQEDYVFHPRLKGIPNKCLETVAKKNYKDDIISMYADLLEHKPIEFDLLEVCKFKFENNFTTINNTEFKRLIQF